MEKLEIRPEEVKQTIVIDEESMEKLEFKPTEVKRIIEFDEESIVANDGVTDTEDDLVSDKDWERFEETALVIHDGNIIYVFAEEYPIVRYERDDKFGADRYDFLNTFVQSITVSTGGYGKTCFVEPPIAREDICRFNEELTDFETVVYYTDTVGDNHVVIQNDIARFLLRKPKLIVSRSGLLVFYTSKSILVTLDCLHYAWVHGINVKEGWSIKSIIPEEDGCHVIVTSNEYEDKILSNATIDKEELEGMKEEFLLEFKIDANTSAMIEPIVKQNL